MLCWAHSILLSRSPLPVTNSSPMSDNYSSTVQITVITGTSDSRSLLLPTDEEVTIQLLLSTL